MWYMYVKGYSVDIPKKKKKVVSLVATWMEVENNRSREVSSAPEHKIHYFSLIRGN